MQQTYDADVLDKCRIGMPLSITYGALVRAARTSGTLLDDGTLIIRALQDRDRYHVVVEHRGDAEDALRGCRIVLTDSFGHTGHIGHMGLFGSSRLVILCLSAGGRFKREVEAAADFRKAALDRFELMLLLLTPGEISAEYVTQVRPPSMVTCG